MLALHAQTLVEPLIEHLPLPLQVFTLALQAPDGFVVDTYAKEYNSKNNKDDRLYNLENDSLLTWLFRCSSDQTLL